MAEDPNERQYASECEAKQIALYHIKDETTPYANLIGMAVTIQYHEDIFWPSFGATMVVVDNQENLISSMPIQGFEKVVMEFEDVLGETYSYTFRIWNISNRITRERRNTYTIGLISQEGLVNEGIRINTIVKGNAAAQVKDILSKKLLVPEGQIDVEASATSIKILPTKKTPFSLIRSLQSKTISERTASGNPSSTSSSTTTGTSGQTDVNAKEAKRATGSAGYLFFQTRKGFVFKSVDNIIDDGEMFDGDPAVNKEDPFYMQAAASGEASRKRIQEIVFGQELNIMKKMREGSYCSLCCFFNINTGEYEERVYSLTDIWDDMAHMGSQTALGVGQQRLSDGFPTRIMSSVINHETYYGGSKVGSNESQHGGDGDNSFPDFQKQYLSQSIARYGSLFHQELTISLTGHLELCAGDKVEVRVPSQLPDETRETDDVWDPEHSGTYLIKRLNHMFNIPGKSVYTVLELIRDSYGIKDTESKTTTEE